MLANACTYAGGGGGIPRTKNNRKKKKYFLKRSEIMIVFLDIGGGQEVQMELGGGEKGQGSASSTLVNHTTTCDTQARVLDK